MYIEAELIRELKKGSELAVAVLVERYSNQLLYVALGICGDMQKAEEVVQDTMLQACRKIDSFGQQAALSSWLYRITVNLAKNSLRKRWIRRLTPWEEQRLQLLAAPAADQPELMALRQETRLEVVELLQRLPVKYREVLALYYLQEFAVSEISAILGQPEGTVKSKLSRGRTKFKQLWAAREGEKNGCV
jgi:RNA polymerase sigma-70 factor (ECF subfamily)